MLTRLYLDNFRCFVNFEHKPTRKQLILGRNGSGKSSYLDAVLLLRQFVVKGDVLEDFFILSQRTRWMNQAHLTGEMEVELDGGRYLYHLVIEPWGEPERPRVKSESVHFDGKPIFEFLAGEVHLYNDRFEHKVAYDFDWHRSALATIMERKDNRKLSRFKHWISNLVCFRLNPFAMGARSEAENLFPNVDLSNIASWYRHLYQSDPKQNQALLESLRSSVDGFAFLKLAPFGENVRLLGAEFAQGNAKTTTFYFNELSDGQRCLTCLYAILHFLLEKGSTVVLDEPDNFISIREIQPWLMAVADVVEAGKGQIILISHHPEVLNQWAPGSGVQFLRDEGGPVRVEEFRGDAEIALPPSELIARGWVRD
ncbi:MAG TPA: AAA family ATPase [Bryobacteraceae bacterium]|nr:AAA family ATPase [Bryobacteraceae bacterium]